MTIEHTDYEEGGSTVKLVECPVCGQELEATWKRVEHLSNHDTTDFGLSEYEQ